VNRQKESKESGDRETVRRRRSEAHTLTTRVRTHEHDAHAYPPHTQTPVIRPAPSEGWSPGFQIILSIPVGYFFYYNVFQ
jgi:hypothetical protein